MPFPIEKLEAAKLFVAQNRGRLVRPTGFSHGGIPGVVHSLVTETHRSREWNRPVINLTSRFPDGRINGQWVYYDPDGGYTFEFHSERGGAAMTARPEDVAAAETFLALNRGKLVRTAGNWNPAGYVGILLERALDHEDTWRYPVLTIDIGSHDGQRRATNHFKICYAPSEGYDLEVYGEHNANT